MNASYSKNEKLKSKKLIEELFTEGQMVSVFPLRLVFINTVFEDGVKLKTGVSVSKRNFKNAVDRNTIKRLMREAYRLQKSSYFNNITTQYAFMILYIGKEIPSFVQVEAMMKQLFEKFLENISNEK